MKAILTVSLCWNRRLTTSHKISFQETAIPDRHRRKRRITYDQIEGSYDSGIFTAEKHGKTFDQAFHADKAIQDYVFTDSTAEDSVERRFVKSPDGSQDVFIYAKLPKGFSIPTPVGHYSPDWAIVFYDSASHRAYLLYLMDQEILLCRGLSSLMPKEAPSSFPQGQRRLHVV